MLIYPWIYIDTIYPPYSLGVWIHERYILDIFLKKYIQDISIFPHRYIVDIPRIHSKPPPLHRFFGLSKGGEFGGNLKIFPGASPPDPLFHATLTPFQKHPKKSAPVAGV